MDTENTERLIEAVKDNAVLYNMSLDGYKNSRLTNKKWDEVGSTMGMTGEAAKKKWKGLRDSYTKHLRSLKTKTGQAAKQLNRYKNWPWADQMTFLKPHVEYAITESNVPPIELEDEEEEEEDDVNDEDGERSISTQDQENNVAQNQTDPGHHNATRCARNERKRKNTTTNTAGPSNADKVISFLQKREPREPQEQDDIDLMFLSFAKTVKKFSAHRKAVTKAKVAQYIMEQEVAHLQENDQAAIASPPSVYSISSRSTPSNYNDRITPSPHGVNDGGSRLHHASSYQQPTAATQLPGSDYQAANQPSYHTLTTPSESASDYVASWSYRDSEGHF